MFVVCIGKKLINFNIVQCITRIAKKGNTRTMDINLTIFDINLKCKNVSFNWVQLFNRCIYIYSHDTNYLARTNT